MQFRRRNMISIKCLLILGAFVIGRVHCQESSTSPPILDPEAVVNVPELGSIQGLKWWTSTNLKPFYVFHGIPYAKSVSGEKRFKPSELWEGPLPSDPFMALDPLVVCPQGMFNNTKAKKLKFDSDLLLNVIKSGLWKWSNSKDTSTSSTSGASSGEAINPLISEIEDCLVLNVNTPVIPKDGEVNPKLPVIFFIHGGSNTQVWGAPFTGFRLLEHPVILVTINYRLGVLGALNLGIDDAPGNAMLYDCLTALDWVHKHIHHFGGDKDRITVYGQSAGSMMATHLLLSPLAAGKFTGVIGASGSALSSWGTADENSLPHHLKVVFHAGCCQDNGGGSGTMMCNEMGEQLPGYDVRKVYECMKNTNEKVLRDALGKYTGIEEKNGLLGFDAKIPSVQNSPRITIPKVLEEMPVDILRQGKQNRVNLIMGANRHDGSFAFETIYDDLVESGQINDNSYMRNELLPVLLKALKGTDRVGAFPNIMAQTYFGERIRSGEFSEMLPGLIDLTTVWGFKAPAYELVTRHANVNPNSFYYAFDFMGFWSTCDLSGTSNIPCGVPHIDDLSFTFQIFPLINEDLRVSQRMVKYFVNFATYGTPNSPGGDDDLLLWPSYEPLTHPFLKIDSEDKIDYNCRDKWVDNGLEIVDFDDNGKVLFTPLERN